MRPSLPGLCFVALAACRSDSASVRPLEPAPEPTPEQPVVCDATVDPPSVRAGEPFTLSVRLRMAPTWHVEPRGGGDGASAATRVAIELGQDLEALSDWDDPAPDHDPATGGVVLTRDVTFTRKLRVNGAATGAHEIAVSVSLRACDPYKCRPPETLVARTSVTVKR
jgi:hypothetical protein